MIGVLMIQYLINNMCVVPKTILKTFVIFFALLREDEALDVWWRGWAAVMEMVFEVCTFQNRLALLQLKYVLFSQQNVPSADMSEIENIEQNKDY